MRGQQRIFEPSSWLLGHMMDSAMARFDADRDRVLLRNAEADDFGIVRGERGPAGRRKKLCSTTVAGTVRR